MSTTHPKGRRLTKVRHVVDLCGDDRETFSGGAEKKLTQMRHMGDMNEYEVL